jgi:hypothetical protein
VNAMRRLAKHDVTARAACYHALGDSPVGGKMPLHVILPCHDNAHLREVSLSIHARLSYGESKIFEPLKKISLLYLHHVIRVETLRILIYCNHTALQVLEW